MITKTINPFQEDTPDLPPDPVAEQMDPDQLNKEAYEGDEGVHFECERKYAVDPDALDKPLPEPWVIVQGYFDDPKHDISVRVIPALPMAYVRIKQWSHSGCRKKKAKDVPYDDAIDLLFQADKVAFKLRYLLRDADGRAWEVDHFPLEHHWQCETELPEDKFDTLQLTPTWVTVELTDSDKGYTANWAQPRSKEQIRGMLEWAAKHGTKAAYEPAQDVDHGGTFEWKQEAE